MYARLYESACVCIDVKKTKGVHAVAAAAAPTRSDRVVRIPAPTSRTPTDKTGQNPTRTHPWRQVAPHKKIPSVGVVYQSPSPARVVGLVSAASPSGPRTRFPSRPTKDPIKPKALSLSRSAPSSPFPRKRLSVDLVASAAAEHSARGGSAIAYSYILR